MQQKQIENWINTACIFIFILFIVFLSVKIGEKIGRDECDKCKYFNALNEVSPDSDVQICGWNVSQESKGKFIMFTLKQGEKQ